jgi:hypothetical protein
MARSKCSSGIRTPRRLSGPHRRAALFFRPSRLRALLRSAVSTRLCGFTRHHYQRELPLEMTTTGQACVVNNASVSGRRTDAFTLPPGLAAATARTVCERPQLKKPATASLRSARVAGAKRRETAERCIRKGEALTRSERELLAEVKQLPQFDCPQIIVTRLACALLGQSSTSSQVWES